MLKNLRQKITPYTAACWGCAALIAFILMAFAAFTARKVGLTFLGVFCVFLATMAGAFWFDFGRCPRCGAVARPFRVRCHECEYPLCKKPEPEAKPGVLETAEKHARDLTETQVASEDIYDGIILHLFKDTIQLPNGDTSPREYVRHVGAVCVVPVTDDGCIVVERQYRYAVGQTLIEIPAGKLDSKDEDRLSAAKRELREETGYTADRWTFMGDYLTAPAFSDEHISMYLAERLHKGDQDLDADEFLDVIEVPIEELVEAVLTGKITDAKTQTGILKAARILKK